MDSKQIKKFATVVAKYAKVGEAVRVNRKSFPKLFKNSLEFESSIELVAKEVAKMTGCNCSVLIGEVNDCLLEGEMNSSTLNLTPKSKPGSGPVLHTFKVYDLVDLITKKQA